MSIIRRDYSPIAKDFGSFLENFFKTQSEDASFVDTGTWAPAVDIKEDKSQFIVIADIPGVNKEDINISLENNILTIEGKRILEKHEEKEGYSRIERAQGQFYRRFSLPKTANENLISAKYKDGVLEIYIPKKEAAAEKRIEVQSD